MYDGYSKIPLSQNNGLQCVTDFMPCCDSDFPTGEWYFPDGRKVPTSGHNFISFYRNRGNDGSVTLNYVDSGTNNYTGKFCCSIPDSNNSLRTLCVNIRKLWLYNIAIIIMSILL